MAQLARRDTGQKKEYSIAEVTKIIPELLEEIQLSMYKKAESLLKDRKRIVNNSETAEEEFDKGNLVYAPWCAAAKCEEEFTAKSCGKSLNAPLKQEKISGKCFNCSNPAKTWFYFGRSY